MDVVNWPDAGTPEKFPRADDGLEHWPGAAKSGQVADLIDKWLTDNGLID